MHFVKMGVNIIPINILSNLVYKKVKLASDVVALRSRKANLGITTKRSGTLTSWKERVMHALPKNQVNTTESIIGN